MKTLDPAVRSIYFILLSFFVGFRYRDGLLDFFLDDLITFATMYLQSITWQLCCPRTLVIIANNKCFIYVILKKISNLSFLLFLVLYLLLFAFYKTKPV